MDPSVEFAFGEIFRKLDELKAQMERRWAAPEERGPAIKPHAVGLEQLDGTPLVKADNWGGLFDEIAPDSTSSDSSSPLSPEKEQRAFDSRIVADNWGGEFEGIPTLSHDPVSTVDVFAEIASSGQIHDIGLASTNSVASAFFTAAPLVSIATTAASVQEKEPVEISPAEYQYQSQIQKLGEPPSTTTGRAAATVEFSVERETRARDFLVGDPSAPHPPRRAPLLRRPRRFLPRPPRPRRWRRAPLPPLRLRRQWRAPPRPPWLRQPRRAPPRPPRLRRPRRAPPRSPRFRWCGRGPHRRGRPPRLRVRGCRPLLRARARRPRPLRGASRDQRRWCTLWRRVWRSSWRFASCGRRSGRHGPRSHSCALPPDPKAGDPRRLTERFDHNCFLWSAMAFLPKLHGGTCCSTRPRPWLDPLDAAMRHYDELLIGSRATNKHFAKAFELVLASCLPSPDDFVKDAESCMYSPTRCSTQVLHGKDFAVELGRWEAVQDMMLLGHEKYYATSGQLLLPATIQHHGLATVDGVLHPELMVAVVLKHARLVFEEMPSTYTTTAHSVHSVSSLLFFGAINNCEGRKICVDMFGLNPVVLDLLVPVNQHQPWPPPEELRLTSCDAGPRPRPCSSFNMIERNSVMCHLSQLWKPPWYVSIQQTVSPCYVEAADFSELDNTRTANPGACVAGVYGGVNSHILIILPAYIHQAMFLVDDVHVLMQVTSAESGATLWTFPEVVWLSNWLCSRLLWKPPWELSASLEIMDGGLDDVGDNDANVDSEHSAEDAILAEPTVKNVAALPSLPRDKWKTTVNGRQLPRDAILAEPTVNGRQLSQRQRGGSAIFPPGTFSLQWLAWKSFRSSRIKNMITAAA